MRKKVIFSINGKVVVEETGELFLNQIDEMKWVIASECECHIDEVEAVTEELDERYGTLDVTPEGLMDWKDITGTVLTGMTCLIPIGSDDYLDAMSMGILEEFIIFN